MQVQDEVRQEAKISGWPHTRSLQSSREIYTLTPDKDSRALQKDGAEGAELGDI